MSRRSSWLVVVASAAILVTLSTAHAGKLGREASAARRPGIVSKLTSPVVRRLGVVAGVCLLAAGCGATYQHREVIHNPAMHGAPTTTITTEEFRIGVMPMTNYLVEQRIIPRGHVLTYDEYHRYAPRYRAYLHQHSLWDHILDFDLFHDRIIVVAPSPSGWWYRPPPPPHWQRGGDGRRLEPRHDGGRGGEIRRDPRGRSGGERGDRDRR